MRGKASQGGETARSSRHQDFDGTGDVRARANKAGEGRGGFVPSSEPFLGGAAREPTNFFAVRGNVFAHFLLRAAGRGEVR